MHDVKLWPSATKDSVRGKFGGAGLQPPRVTVAEGVELHRHTHVALQPAGSSGGRESVPRVVTRQGCTHPCPACCVHPACPAPHQLEATLLLLLRGPSIHVVKPVPDPPAPRCGSPCHPHEPAGADTPGVPPAPTPPPGTAGAPPLPPAGAGRGARCAPPHRRATGRLHRRVVSGQGQPCTVLMRPHNESQMAWNKDGFSAAHAAYQLRMAARGAAPAHLAC